MPNKEGYKIPTSIKRKAQADSLEFGIEADSIHHIVPKDIAKKYHLDRRKIKSADNAIGLEQDFHDWIHENFEEDDYIYLAINLLGFTEEDFAKEYQKEKKHRHG